MDNKEIGKRIKTKRKAEKLTQKELASKIGKQEITIRKYESGDITIPTVVINEIAKALNVSPYDLLLDTEQLANEVKSIEANIGLTKSLFKHYGFDLPDCSEDEWHYYSVQVRNYIDYLQYIYNKGLKEGE